MKSYSEIQTDIRNKADARADRGLDALLSYLRYELGRQGTQNLDRAELREMVMDLLLCGADIAQDVVMREAAKERQKASVNMIRAALAVSALKAKEA